MKVVDLTKPIYPGMKVYEGDPKVEFLPHVDIREKGYKVTLIKMGTHTGTHIDAPSHMIEDAGVVDEIELSELIGYAFKIIIEKKILDESDIPLIEGNEGNVIPLIKTSSGGYLTKKAAEKLVRSGVKTVLFHENCLIDDPKNSDFPIHKFLLENGIRIVSDAVNFESVENGYLVVIAPLKLVNADGAPCRVIAIGDLCYEDGGEKFGGARRSF